MSVEYNVKQDVEIKKDPINFHSYSFLRDLIKIKQENEKIDQSSKIDYIKMFRRIEI